jgi:DNA-directed RNA polymerase subunit beta'
VKSKDKLVVEHEEKVVRGQVVLTRGKDEITADDNAYAIIKDKILYLVAQDQRLEIRNGAELHVQQGEIIPAEQTIASFDPFSEPIISEYGGTIRFRDIVDGTTLKKEVNEDTGNTENKIVEHPVENMQPSLVIEDGDGEEVYVYPVPNSAYLSVSDGDTVQPGHVLAKMLKESVKTRDITGGLPRVGELFEARRPKSAAVLAQISGIVRTGNVVKGKRQVFVDDAYGREYKHMVPMGRHLLVRDGDAVEAGEQLCDGNIDPHDVLAILGENQLQSFLVNEVQEVYRLQGVNINDKHIGVIIRQMMRKLEIVQVGDTNFIFGQQVDKHKFREENARVMKQGGQPAVGRPLLLGITRASLNIDSFISAASFQETTRVLTNAAIAGQTDQLRGLKENVVIGHLIPAGTGMRNYKRIRLYDDQTEDLDAHVEQILEERAREKELEEQQAEDQAPEPVEVEATE